MQIVLKFLNLTEHPLKGYPETYIGHKRLVVDGACCLASRPIFFSGLLGIQEALLLLGHKDQIGRQFDIRNAIMDHISNTVLTADELYKIGLIHCPLPRKSRAMRKYRHSLHQTSLVHNARKN